MPAGLGRYHYIYVLLCSRLVAHLLAVRRGVCQAHTFAAAVMLLPLCPPSDLVETALACKPIIQPVSAQDVSRAFSDLWHHCVRERTTMEVVWSIVCCKLVHAPLTALLCKFKPAFRYAVGTAPHHRSKVR